MQTQRHAYADVGQQGAVCVREGLGAGVGQGSGSGAVCLRVRVKRVRVRSCFV